MHTHTEHGAALAGVSDEPWFASSCFVLPQLLCVFDLSLQDVSLLDRMGFHTFVMGRILVQHLTQIKRKLQGKAEDLCCY